MQEERPVEETPAPPPPDPEPEAEPKAEPEPEILVSDEVLEQAERRMEEHKPEPETRLRLRAKTMLTIGGIVYNADEVFELPEREALNLVGMGSAEELP